MTLNHNLLLSLLSSNQLLTPTPPTLLIVFGPKLNSIQLWLREEVTYHTCYDTQSQLITQLAKFQPAINANPTHIADRLWTKTQLDSTEEKLRFSK